ncbi:acyl carrier protein [Actinoplanes sp. TBRC 11911]|uniref:acyl carrier protein n=1 Tax=Actinoplanes sp. TBRC 11911 TaxID=2729386 RepID=UPI00145F3FA7|nr:acyl carrier protein [Actinoplanes sp. TBRC 11911]NMO53365.1 acyl carrier protein [Actinoplanes sp. TBRC 11911]
MEKERFDAVVRRNLPGLDDGAPLAEDQDLADLGMDSLGAVRLLAELESEFAVELPDDALDETVFRTAAGLWRAFATRAVPATD